MPSAATNLTALGGKFNGHWRQSSPPVAVKFIATEDKNMAPWHLQPMTPGEGKESLASIRSKQHTIDRELASRPYCSIYTDATFSIPDYAASMQEKNSLYPWHQAYPQPYAP